MTPLIRIGYLIVSLFILSSYSKPGDGDWKLKKNENGIAVYTRTAEGSDIKELKVVNQVKSSFAGVIGLLLDTKNYPNWIGYCKEGATLKVISPREIYKYQYTNAPWPVNDRDVVSDFKISQDGKTKVVTIVDSALPDFIPPKKGIVRIQHFRAHYTITKLKDGMLQVVYECFLDPGGALPDWAVNETLVDVPYKNTVAMSKQLPKYQSSSYPFIKE